MVSDSATPASACRAGDLGKKKRSNRSARLKQCKLDARREQWLSQVKSNGGVGSKRGEKGLLMEKILEVKARGHEKSGGREEGNRKCSDSESSPFNSPGSVGSGVSSGSNASGTCFTTGSCMSSTASSGGTCSGNVTEEEEETVDESDGCVDDWEAIADALAEDDKRHTSNSDPPNDQEFSFCSESSRGGSEKGSPHVDILKSQPLRASKFNRGTRAWRQGDTFHPRCLPNLSKQRSLPLKSSAYLGCGAGGFRSLNSTKLVASACDCPICYEELDLTDASFNPCPCGFRMCLFCYKRICDDDGRCPSCREQYKN